MREKALMRTRLHTNRAASSTTRRSRGIMLRIGVKEGWAVLAGACAALPQSHPCWH